MIKQKKQGFTLAELLVVMAIIGILVAISIPIFTAQRRKAIIAVNKANIRAAKAAAAAKLYESPESIIGYMTQENGQYLYYLYNVETGSIEKELVGVNVTFKDTSASDNKEYTKTVNNWGQEYRKIAMDGKKCHKILIYVGNPEKDLGKDGKNSSPIQTAPFYVDDEVGGTSSNPFGPNPGFK